MASSYSSRSVLRSADFTHRARNLAHRMTRHVAAALLLFALSQIWLVGAALEAGAPRLISVLALSALVGLAIPYARSTERRWHNLGQDALPSPALTTRFRRDVVRLWLLALLVPALWVGGALLFAPAIAHL